MTTPRRSLFQSWSFVRLTGLPVVCFVAIVLVLSALAVAASDQLVVQGLLISVVVVAVLFAGVLLVLLHRVAGAINALAQFSESDLLLVSSELVSLADRLTAQQKRNVQQIADLETRGQRNREAFYRLGTGLVLSVPRVHGRILAANHALATLLGRTEDDLLVGGLRPLPDADLDAVEKLELAALLDDSKASYTIDRAFAAGNGTIVWACITTSLISGDAEWPSFAISVFHDVTDARRAHDHLRKNENYRELIEHASDITLVIKDRIIIYASPASERLLGYFPSEMQNQVFRSFVHSDDMGIVIASSAEGEKKLGQPISAEVRMRHKDGEWRVMDVIGQTIPDSAGIRSVLNLRDVTVRRSLERALADREQALRRREQDLLEVTAALESANMQLRELSTSDPLTGLANRRAFDEAFVREWANARRGGSDLCLLLFDIDEFKAYNDALGHLAGDICLQEVALQARQHLNRENDLLVRWGGEEFLVLLPGTDSDGGALVAERLRAAIEGRRLPHPKSSVSRWVTISVGVASVVPTMDLLPQDLLTATDKAMYAAKAADRNRVVVWQEDRLGDASVASI